MGELLKIIRFSTMNWQKTAWYAISDIPGYISNFLITYTPFCFSIGLRKHYINSNILKTTTHFIYFLFLLDGSYFNVTDNFKEL